jgi:hypothetical protein
MPGLRGPSHAGRPPAHHWYNTPPAGVIGIIAAVIGDQYGFRPELAGNIVQDIQEQFLALLLDYSKSIRKSDARTPAEIDISAPTRVFKTVRFEAWGCNQTFDYNLGPLMDRARPGEGPGIHGAQEKPAP